MKNEQQGNGKKFSKFEKAFLFTDEQGKMKSIDWMIALFVGIILLFADLGMGLLTTAGFAALVPNPQGLGWRLLILLTPALLSVLICFAFSLIGKFRPHLQRGITVAWISAAVALVCMVFVFTAEEFFFFLQPAAEFFLLPLTLQTSLIHYLYRFKAGERAPWVS